VVEVVVGVPQVFAETLGLLSNLLTVISALEYSALFVFIDVGGQILLLVGVEDVEESLVVDYGLSSVHHRGLHFLQHGLQQGKHLL